MAIHKHNDWTISSRGGFITVKHFVANNNNGLPSHWAFRLKDCKVLCDKRDAGEEIDELFLEPLYN